MLSVAILVWIPLVEVCDNFESIIGIVGLFKILATPLAASQSELTCAAGIVGLFKISARPLVASQSALTGAAGIVGLFKI